MTSQTTEIPIPKPVWLGDIFGYSEAQLKAYGDERAKAALEQAAISFEGETNDSGHFISEGIRFFKGKIK
jgi:hypothetical protein